MKNGISILAIDPGPEQSAYVVYDGQRPVAFRKIGNEDMLAFIRGVDCDAMVIEQVAAMGMAVGAEVFETVFWSGRFAQLWGHGHDRMKRHEVKMFFCGNTRAKDANIRQALIDRFGPGRQTAIGNKKCPGPLYGIKADVWQALALAVCYFETRLAERT